MKNPEVFERACDLIEKSLTSAVDELEGNGTERLSSQDAEYLDSLVHAVKSIGAALAMEGYGKSERRGRSPSTGRYVSRDGGSYDGSYEGSYDGSYEGSYRSYEGRSGNPKAKLRRMMEETDDERVRRALQTAMRQM